MVAITKPESFKVIKQKGDRMHDSDFDIWREKLGFHQRENSEAGKLIGVTGRTKITELRKGERELSQTERLAMAAVRAGLPEWTPETDEEIHALGVLRQTLASSHSSSGD